MAAKWNSCETGWSRYEPPITQWVRRSDDEALAEVMKHYRPMLLAIARQGWDRRFQARADLSDAVQQAWSAVALKLPKKNFACREEFQVYLIKTIRSQLISLRRFLIRTQKRSVVREVRLEDDSVDHQAFQRQPSVTPLDQVIQQEFSRLALDAIRKLPRELQRLLILRFRRGLTYREIAERMHRSEDEARRLVDHAVCLIRKDIRGVHGMDRYPPHRGRCR